MSKRALLVFTDDNEAMEDLIHALNSIQHAPYKPKAPGAPYGSPQEQYTDKEVDKFAIAMIRGASDRIHFGGSVIVP